MPLTDVVMLGHFDDRRAATCPSDDREAVPGPVRGRPGLVGRTGSLQPISDASAGSLQCAVATTDDGRSAWSTHAVPDGQVLSILSIRLRRASTQEEPSIGNPADVLASGRTRTNRSPRRSSATSRARWSLIATVLKAGRLVTYVEDGPDGCRGSKSPTIGSTNGSSALGTASARRSRQMVDSAFRVRATSSGVRRLVGHPTAGHRQEHPARQLHPEQRRVLATRQERLGADRPALRAIEDDEVGGRALDEPDRGRATAPLTKDPCRPDGQHLDGARAAADAPRRPARAAAPGRSRCR